jgi:nicotinate-nucleotide adenylyltransferase
VHKAHLAIAQAALSGLGLSGVRWIPSGRPGHRAEPSTSVAHRLAMLRLALADERRFTLDEADARSAKPTYTVDTLQRLRAELGSALPLVFIIGSDQFGVLETWKDWQRLFDLAHFAVAGRPGYSAEGHGLSPRLAEELAARHAVRIDGRPAGTIVPFSMPPSTLSASAIRAALAKGQDPGDALPPAVLAYIRSHHLYMEQGI